MKDDAFELYWQSHRRELLSKNKEYREIEESYKMRTGFDWLLWAVAAFDGNPGMWAEKRCSYGQLL